MRNLQFNELQQLQQIIQENLERQRFEQLLAQIGQPPGPDDNDPVYAAMVFRMLTKANMTGWHFALIHALLAHLPDNDPLLQLAAATGMTARGESNLEALVSSSSHLLDLGETLRRFARLEQQICRLEINAPNGQKRGTGFLVGPDLVLTNYHVVEDLILNRIAPDQVAARFDYKTLEGDNAKVISQGTVHQLKAANPVLAHSPYHPMDGQVGSLDRQWPADHLDFALLQLEKEAGKELPGGSAQLAGTHARPRGWITLPKSGFTLKTDDLLIIVQHPDDLPITWSFDSKAVIGSDPNGQRVRYRASTKKGSSGSPCFNGEWKLVALHHAGDPNFWDPGYNQGIPIMLIAEFLKKKNLLQLLTFGELQLAPVALPPPPPPPAAGPNPDEPFECVYINDTAPFVPRGALKLAAKNMIKGTGGKVLLLKGDAKPGFSYTFHFIQQAAKPFGMRCIYLPLKFLFSQEGTAQAMPLAVHLTQKMLVEYDFPEEKEFKLTVFFSTFGGIVAAREEQYLVYLDDLATFPMTTECANFIKSLALTVQNDLPNACLVLAGFKDNLPIEIAPFIKPVRLDNFKENDLTAFFKNFYSVLPKMVNKPLAETEDEFVNNSKAIVQDLVDLQQIPNVENVGTNLKDYCDLLIENLQTA